MTTSVFITIDGVDGVGKTTVAQLLASGGAFHYYKSPAGPFAQLRREVDNHATPLERYCFYRVATQYDSTKIGQLLEGTSVVCDRYIASTVAYHVAMDARVRAVHSDDGLLKPDFAFLLGARSEIRDKRILERAKMKILSDAKLEGDSALLDRVAEIFRSFDLIYVDTSDITAEEVVGEIKRIVLRGGRT